MKRKVLTKLGALALSTVLTTTGVPISSYAQSGWVKKYNQWLYFMPSGEKASGWVKDNDRWYYIDPATGTMKTGWLQSGDKWFFLSTAEGKDSGLMLSGWNWIDGYCYYFSESGAMAAGEKTADGYLVDSSGHWTDENGTVQFVKGKGFSSKINTATAPSRSSKGSGAGSGSSSGSGSGSNSGRDNSGQNNKPDNSPDNNNGNNNNNNKPDNNNGGNNGTKPDNNNNNTNKPDNNNSDNNNNANKPDNNNSTSKQKDDNNSPEIKKEEANDFVTVADYENSNILSISKTKDNNLASIQEKVYQKFANDEQKSNVYFLELDNQVLVVDLNNILLGNRKLSSEDDSLAISKLSSSVGKIYYADKESQNMLIEAPDNKLDNLGAGTSIVLLSGKLDIKGKLTSKYILGLPGNLLNSALVALEDTKEVAGINFISDNTEASKGTNGSMLSIKSTANDFSLSVNNNSFSFKDNDEQTGLYRAIGIYSVAGKLNISKNRFEGHNIKNGSGSNNSHAMIDCQARLSGAAGNDKYSQINIKENTFENVYSSGIALFASEKEAVNIENNKFNNIGEDAIRIDAVAIEYPLEHTLNIVSNEIKKYGVNDNTGYTDNGFGPLGPVNTGEAGININYYDGTQKGSKVNGFWHSDIKQLEDRLKADNSISPKEENDKNSGVVDSQAVKIGQKGHYINTAQKINQAGSPSIKNHSIVIVKNDNGDVVYGRDESAATTEIAVKDLYITGTSSGTVTLPNTLLVKGNLKVDLPNGFVKLEARVLGSTQINASTIKNSAKFTPLNTSPIPRGAATDDYAVQISDVRNDNGDIIENFNPKISVTLEKDKLPESAYHYKDGILYIHKDVINTLTSNAKLSIKLSSPENGLSEVSSSLILIEISNMSGAEFKYSTKTFTHMDAEAPIQIKVSGIKNNKGEVVEASKTKLKDNVDFLIFGQAQDKSLISVDDDTDTITLSTELLNYLYATKYENTPDRNANFGMRHSYELLINDADNNIYDVKDSVEFEVIDRSGVDFVFENGMTFTQGEAPEGGITLSIKNVANTRGSKVLASDTEIKDSAGMLNMNIEPFPVKRDSSDDSEIIVIRDKNGEYLKEIFNPKYIVVDDDKDTITFTKEYLDKIEPHKDNSTESGIKTFTFKYTDTAAKVDVRSQKVALHVKLKEKALSNNTDISFKDNTLFIEDGRLKFSEGFDTNNLIAAGLLKNIIKHNPRQQLILSRNSAALRSFDSILSGDTLKVIAEDGKTFVEYTLDFNSPQNDRLYKSFDENLISEFSDTFIMVKNFTPITIKQLREAIVLQDEASMKVLVKDGGNEYEPTPDTTIRSDMVLVLSKAGKEQRYNIRLQDGVQYRALLVGNQDYGSSKLNLAGPENDIRMMNSLLKRADFDGEKFDIVNTKKNLKKQEFLDSIAQTFKDATDDDVSYLYYSGHGYNVKSSNTSYICTVDKTLEDKTEAEAAKSWISVDELKAALDKVPGTKVIILDCCNAGGFIGKDFVDATSGATYGKSIDSSSEEFINSASEVFESSASAALNASNIESNNKNLNYLTDNDYKVLVASSANEYSYESKKTATGKFTLEFVNGAGYKGGSLLADSNANGKVSLDEMYTYLMANVESTSHIQVFPHNDPYTLFAGVKAKEAESSTLVKIKNNAYSFYGRLTPKGEQLGTIKGNLVKINTKMSASAFMQNIEKSYEEQSITLESGTGVAYTDSDTLRRNDTYLRVVAENGNTSRYPVVVEEFIDHTPNSNVVIKGNTKIKVTADEEREIYAISLDSPMKMSVFINTLKNLNKKSSFTFKLLDKNDNEKTFGADVMAEHLDRLLVTSSDNLRSVKYTISVLSNTEKTIESEFTLKGGVISSGTKKLSSKTTVLELKKWLMQNNIDLSEPLTGVYRAGTNPPFGRAKAPNQTLEEGDRFILRSFTGTNTIYAIELEKEDENTAGLSELTPDFGDALLVENGIIKSKNLKLTTDTTVSDILLAWQNKADFDKVTDMAKSGIYTGSTLVISGVPNKAKKGNADTIGYGYKLIFIPLNPQEAHISYEIELADEGGSEGPIITSPIITVPEGMDSGDGAVSDREVASGQKVPSGEAVVSDESVVSGQKVPSDGAVINDKAVSRDETVLSSQKVPSDGAVSSDEKVNSDRVINNKSKLTDTQTYSIGSADESNVNINDGILGSSAVSEP